MHDVTSAEGLKYPLVRSKNKLYFMNSEAMLAHTWERGEQRASSGARDLCDFLCFYPLYLEGIDGNRDPFDIFLDRTQYIVNSPHQSCIALRMRDKQGLMEVHIEKAEKVPENKTDADLLGRNCTTSFLQKD